MKVLTIVLLLLLPTAVMAQNMPYTNQTEVGILAGNGVYPSFSAQTFNGVKINNWNLEAGFIIGVDVYPQIVLLPLSAGLKWNPFNTRRVSPYLSLNAGYGFDWLQRKMQNWRYDGGYMINPSLGIRIKTKKAAKVNLSMGFRQQRAVVHQSSTPYYDFIWEGPEIYTKEEYKFSRVSIRLGLSF